MLKQTYKYILFTLLGLIVGLMLLNSKNKRYKREQIDIIHNGIENVSKLVVVEETITEYYDYNDAKLYFFDSKFFEKQIILLVNAKVLVSYDLREMQTELDTIRKKIIIKSIPKEEMNVIPTYRYYDFDQSIFNSFSKEDLNNFQAKSTQRLIEDLDVSNSKTLAKKRLLEELKQLWSVAGLLGWTIEDQTDQKLLEDLDISPTFKDSEQHVQ